MNDVVFEFFVDFMTTLDLKKHFEKFAVSHDIHHISVTTAPTKPELL